MALDGLSLACSTREADVLRESTSPVRALGIDFDLQVGEPRLLGLASSVGARAPG